MPMQVKENHICEKDYIWNSATCGCKISKYFASFIDDSVIRSDEIKETKSEETKTIPKNFNEKSSL